MDISGGLLAKNIMPFGEHKRCLTCKYTTLAAPAMTQATHDSPPNESAQEITQLIGMPYQKEKLNFEE